MSGAQWVMLLLIVVSVLYSATSIAYIVNLRPGMALTFIGYVIANIGLIWDAMGGNNIH